MSDWKLPWEGGCRCGQVRLKVTKPPMLSATCHCTGCQTMTGSAFSMSLALPRDGLETTGELVLGGLQTENHHHFCAACKTWLYTRSLQFDFFVNLRASTLDDHSWFVPYVDFWTSEKLPWVTTPAPHKFGALPPMDQFDVLMKAYATEGARP